MIQALPLYPQADDLVGRGTRVIALTSSLAKHKRCFLPAAVVTFPCQSDFLCVTQSLWRAAPGERLSVASGSSRRAFLSSVSDADVWAESCT